MAQTAEPAPLAPPLDIDLAGPFKTHSPWHLTATQAPPLQIAAAAQDGDTIPGLIQLCLRIGSLRACHPELQSTMGAIANSDAFAGPRYLGMAKIVHPLGRSGYPLLIVRTGGLYSGDGDQNVFTQVLAYNHATDRFVRVYDHLTGRNNNQDVRYVEGGPLDGDIISVEPTANAPFGFWVSVNVPAAGPSYRQTLRYRSATGYEDGNPLPVIDSEMPNIERRLGLWKAGLPLPLPAIACPKPHLVRFELWCRL